MPDRSPSLLARKALALWENEGGAPEAVDAALLGPVLDLAKRLGVENGSSAHRVTLTQSGDMRLGRGTRRTRFRGRQTIDITNTSFEWRAGFGAEVGWTIDGQVVNYWRGTMTSWTVA